MANRDFNFHFVSTRGEAKGLLDGREVLYVSNCRCRESKGDCRRSHMDVCVHFDPAPPSTRQISDREAADILEEARVRHLVPRPFRNNDGTGEAGICFCCDDCCTYFADHAEPCDKGASIEQTTMRDCLHCGACQDVCYFHARAHCRRAHCASIGTTAMAAACAWMYVRQIAFA